MKPKWFDAAKVRLNRAYSAAGASAHLQFRHFDGGHQWDGTTALPLLKSVLMR